MAGATRSWIAQLPGIAGLLVSLSLGGIGTLAASEDGGEATIKGYIVTYTPRSGKISIIRGAKPVSRIGKGTPVHGGDVILVSGNSSVEVLTDDDDEIITASNSGYRVTFAAPITAGWLESLGRHADAIRNLRTKMPPRFAHQDSRGAGNCLRDSPSVSLRPNSALAADHQTLPVSASKISLAWTGGVPPYTVTTDEQTARGAATRLRGRFCSNAVDNVDLSDTINEGTFVLTVTDAIQDKFVWVLQFVDDIQFRRLVTSNHTDSAIDDAAFAVLALTNSNRELHLAGLTAVTTFAPTNFVAWRLKLAVNAEETY